MSFYRVGEKRSERTESPLEEKVFQSMKKLGLQPRLQIPFHTFWLDMCFIDEKVAIELDGKKYHDNSEAKKRDARKDALLRSEGWSVERFDGWLAWRSPDVIAAKVGLRYLKHKLTPQNILFAQGSIAKFFLERDPEMGIKIVEGAI